jgi:hypothetical protein
LPPSIITCPTFFAGDPDIYEFSGKTPSTKEFAATKLQFPIFVPGEIITLGDTKQLRPISVFA